MDTNISVVQQYSMMQIRQHPNKKSVYQSDLSRDAMVTPHGNQLIIKIIIAKPTITYLIAWVYQ